MIEVVKSIEIGYVPVEGQGMVGKKSGKISFLEKSFEMKDFPYLGKGKWILIIMINYIK